MATSSVVQIRSTASEQYVHGLATAWRQNRLWDTSFATERDPDAPEKMLRDARIAAAVFRRREWEAGTDWVIDAGKDPSPHDKALASVLDTLVRDYLKGFTPARQQLAMSFFHGRSYAAIEGRRMPLRIGNKVRQWWVPTRLKNIDRRRIQPFIERSGMPDQHVVWKYHHTQLANWVPITDTRRLISMRFDETESTLTHGNGLINALYFWWQGVAEIFKEAIQAASRSGQGTAVAKVKGAKKAGTALPNAEVVNKWRKAIERARESNVLVMDTDDEIDIVDLTGDAVGFILDFRDRLYEEMDSLILGSTRPTGGGGEGGSYARAAIEQDSTESLIKTGRQAQEEALSEGLLGYLCFQNSANLHEMGLSGARRGRLSIIDEKPTDPLVEAQVTQTLLGAGVPLDRAEVYEKSGRTVPQVGAEVIKPQPKPEPFNPFGGGGGGFGAPGGSGGGVSGQ